MSKFSNVIDVSATTGSTTSLSSQTNSMGDDSTFKVSTTQSGEAPLSQTIARVNEITNLPLEYQVIPQPRLLSSFDSPETFTIIHALSNYIISFLPRHIGIF